MSKDVGFADFDARMAPERFTSLPFEQLLVPVDQGRVYVGKWWCFLNGKVFFFKGTPQYSNSKEVALRMGPKGSYVQYLPLAYLLDSEQGK